MAITTSPNYGTAVRAARVFRYYGRRPAGGRADNATRCAICVGILYLNNCILLLLAVSSVFSNLLCVFLSVIMHG